MKREDKTRPFGTRSFRFARLRFYIFRKGFVEVATPKLERKFQAKLIKELKQLFEGCLVIKTDSGHIQGLPDLLILFGDKWASLEVKRESKASVRPNQEHYVELMNKMSFSRFISPENKEDVLRDLQQTFGLPRTPRLPRG